MQQTGKFWKRVLCRRRGTDGAGSVTSMKLEPALVDMEQELFELPQKVRNEYLVH